LENDSKRGYAVYLVPSQGIYHSPFDVSGAGVSFTPLKLAPDGVLASCSSDGAIVAIAGAASLAMVTDAGEQMIDPVPLQKPACLEMTGDGRMAVVASQGGRLAFIRHPQGICATRQADSEVSALCFTGDGKRAASGQEDGLIRVWDTDSFEPTGALMRSSNRVTAMSFSGDGLFLVSGHADGMLRIWDVESGEKVGKPLKLGGEACYVEMVERKRGPCIVAVSTDGDIVAWDAGWTRGTASPEELVSLAQAITMQCINDRGETEELAGRGAWSSRKRQEVFQVFRKHR